MGVRRAAHDAAMRRRFRLGAKPCIRELGGPKLWDLPAQIRQRANDRLRI